MKKIFATLSVLALLAACGPKTETPANGTDTTKTTKDTVTPTAVDSPKVGEAPAPDTLKDAPPATDKPGGKVSVKEPEKVETKGRLTVNGKWYLDNWGGKKLNPTEWPKGVPNIDINTEKSSFSGFGGCNSISGSAVLTNGTDMDFSKIMQTKMFCEGVNESGFTKMLNEVTSFSIIKGNLSLRKNGSIVAVFVRKND